MKNKVILLVMLFLSAGFVSASGLNIGKVYKVGFVDSNSSFRTVMISPGDLCGCRTIFFNNFNGGIY